MDEFKKILLAGIGLTSMTVEKTETFLKDLVDKGRLTVAEGKELQTELKRQAESQAQESIKEFQEKTKGVQYATKEDLERIEAKLDALISKSE